MVRSRRWLDYNDGRRLPADWIDEPDETAIDRYERSRYFQPYVEDVAGGVAGDAPGATITVTASIIPGAATGDAVAPGASLLVASPSLLTGSATGASGAQGSTVQSSVSMVPGTATGGAAAAGATLNVATSLVAGSASGGTASVPGDAPGALITSSPSLLPGSATGGALAGGTTLPIATPVTPGAATGAAEAPGATIVVLAGFLPGTAVGDLPEEPQNPTVNVGGVYRPQFARVSRETPERDKDFWDGILGLPSDEAPADVAEAARAVLSAPRLTGEAVDGATALQKWLDEAALASMAAIEAQRARELAEAQRQAAIALLAANRYAKMVRGIVQAIVEEEVAIAAIVALAA